MVKANYSIVECTNDFVVIKDDYDSNNPTMSVTNDAEAVVDELVDLGVLGDRRLLYYDTYGNLDEIVHCNGEFIEFQPFLAAMEWNHNINLNK